MLYPPQTVLVMKRAIQATVQRSYGADADIKGHRA